AQAVLATIMMFPLDRSCPLGGPRPTSPRPKGPQFRARVREMITEVAVSLAKSGTHPRRHGLAGRAPRAVTFSRHAGAPPHVAESHLHLRLRRRPPTHVITVKPRD